MPPGSLNPKEVGYYFTIAQVGLEMVVPIALGLWLENLLGWQPWGVVGGAVLGLTGGLLHLLQLVKKQDDKDTPQPPRDLHE